MERLWPPVPIIASALAGCAVTGGFYEVSVAFMPTGAHSCAFNLGRPMQTRFLLECVGVVGVERIVETGHPCPVSRRYQLCLSLAR
jgi:hypothetical protein